MNIKSLVHIKQTKRRGRGVFASCDLKKNQIVEISPVIPFKVQDIKRPQHFPLWDYQLAWRGKKDAIGMGYLMLYNHSLSSNATFTRDYKNKVIIVKAKRNIVKNEELTINYACPLWFKEV